MKLKLTMLLGLLMVASLVLTACGGGCRSNRQPLSPLSRQPPQPPPKHHRASRILKLPQQNPLAR